MIAKIEALMEARGLNPTRLSKMACVPPSSFHAMMKDGRKFTFEAVAAVAKALSVSLDYLAEDGMETPPRKLTEAENQAVKMVRAMQLTEDEVIERLTRDPKAMPEIAVEKPVRRRDRRA